jgi:23S rRNA (cytosine1962-C5)-methyltransferase
VNDPVKIALQNFFQEHQTEPRRVFHGRGQLFPGYGHLCIDWYPPTLFISAHQPIVHLPEIQGWAKDSDQHNQIEMVMLQKRYIKDVPTEILFGKQFTKIVVEENELKYEVRLGGQQNTGLFLDMRPFRAWIKSNSSGRKILNLFAYTCSFSVAAIEGGAKSVVNVDMSKSSLRWGENNHGLNGHDLRKVVSLPHNVFTSWGKIKQLGRYDLIIIDPPSRQKHSFDSEKNYGAVIKKLRSLCKEDAVVIATLNDPFLDQQFLLDKFSKYAPETKFMGLMPVAPEFSDNYPERGLKICRFRHQRLKNIH